MRFHPASFALLALLAVACSNGGGTQSASGSASPEATATATAADLSATAAPSAAASQEAATPAAVASTAVAAASRGPAFTDITGSPAATAIDQEAALGIFGPTGGKFNPDGQVTRGQYIAWLVTANNLYFADAPAGQIRPAASNADQQFVDVPKSHKFYAPIEGMADAGYVIGIDKNHFAPDQPLTREQLVAIQTARYMNGATFSPITRASGMYCVHLTDAEQVSKPYWSAFNTDACTGFSGQDDLHRIFGSIRTLHPQRPATRAEVAIALQKIAGRFPPTPAPH